MLLIISFFLFFLSLIFFLYKKQKKIFHSHLHKHIIIAFSSISFIPAAIVLIFSVFFLNIWIESWIGKPIEKALNRSYTLSAEYLNKHKELVRFDINSIIPDVTLMLSYHLEKDWEYILQGVADQKGFSDIIIFNQKGEIIAKSALTFSKLYDADITYNLDNTFKNIAYGEIHLTKDEKNIKGIVKINKKFYLFINKPVDPEINYYLEQSKKTLNFFEKFFDKRDYLFKQIIVVFLSLAFLLFIISLFISFKLSNSLIVPIKELIDASVKVSHGDLSVQVNKPMFSNEINILVNVFNQMVVQIERQKKELSISERKAAWSDVARKIAHEIKNPLTPIQLGSEQLKRKYSKEIKKDKENFNRYIDMINEQVQHIQILVEEFSLFARMPDPCPVEIDLVSSTRNVMQFFKQAYPQIVFEFECDFKNLMAFFDRQQFTQVLNNLIKNSVLILIDRHIKSPKVFVYIKKENQKNKIMVEDNGPGFSNNDLKHSLDLYYTNRRNGSGLGLSIVKRIMIDHGGEIILSNNEETGGAISEVIF